MIEVTDLAIEPEVDSRNWRRREVTESCQKRAGGRVSGRMRPVHRREQQAEDIELLLLSVGGDKDFKPWERNDSTPARS